MSGPGAVAALVFLEWAAGSLGASAWAQSWTVVRRGHFKIVGWTCLGLAAAGSALSLDVSGGDLTWFRSSAMALTILAVIYLAAQYTRTDRLGSIAGYAGAAVGVATMWAAALDLYAWSQIMAALQLIAGGVFLGAVTNGMLLGHWYLNQPGLKPWALARLTLLALAATAATAAVGLAATAKLTNANTAGAILGIPGFGEDFGVVFFVFWVILMVFTGAVVWGARRCIEIKSIQSATGLYYVALLSAGVAEFIVRYLMVNA